MDPLYQYSDLALLFLRICVGVIFLIHGWQKRGTWKAQPSAQMSQNMLSQMRLLSITEPLGGLAILVGIFTPLAAFGLSLIMLGALYYKISVWKLPFTEQGKNGWEFDLIILAACAALITFGGGLYSLGN